MSTRLNQIGGQIKGLTTAEQTLAAQGKAIPSKVAEAFKAEDEALNLASTTLGFKQTDKLRSAIVSNPETAGQALSRMDAPAKSSLARGVMQDAGKASDPLKHLTDNEQGIMRVLKANDPKTAQSTFTAAKDAAELAKIIEETGNKLGMKTPTNAMVTQQNLSKLTQDLPQVRAVVKDIQDQLAQGKTFDELAAQGSLGKNSALRLLRMKRPNSLARSISPVGSFSAAISASTLVGNLPGLKNFARSSTLRAGLRDRPEYPCEKSLSQGLLR
jgi:hypothetical protein